MAIYLVRLSNIVQELELSRNCAKRPSQSLGQIFVYSDLKFTAIQFEMRGMLICNTVLHSEAVT